MRKRYIKVVVATALFSLILYGIGNLINLFVDFDWKWVFVFYFLIMAGAYIEEHEKVD